MNRTVALLLVIGLAAMTGCASPPDEEIAASRQALEEARAAEAADYAPPSMSEAENLMAELDAELQVQQEKSRMFRSYDRATELAAQVQQASNQAVADAALGKEQAREEAEALIAEVRASLDEVKTMLANAPRGKGSRADIMVRKADLAAVETGLGEIEASFAAGDYADAIAKAEAANQTTLSTKEAIAAAIQLKSQASRTDRS